MLCTLTVFQLAPAQQISDTAVEDFFVLAELKLPGYFPPGPGTLIQGEYLYRYYSITDTYLGVGYGHVWLLGGEFGTGPVDAGEFTEVLALLVDFPDAETNLWNLTVSGTIYYEETEGPGAGQLAFRNFDRFELQEVQQPDFNDIDAVFDDFRFNLAGEVSGIVLLYRVIVNDTPTQKTLAVKFETPHESGVITYFLLLDYTR